MSIEQKQQYLRLEIMENGHDPSLFYDHWQSLNLDLETVTLQTLKQVVSQFKQKLSQNQQFTEYQSPANHHFDIDWSFLEIKSYKHIKPQAKQLLHQKQKVGQIDILNMNEKDSKVQTELYKRQQRKLVDNSISLKDIYKSCQNTTYKCLKLQENILDHHVNVQIIVNSKDQKIQNDVVQNGSGIIGKLWKQATGGICDIPLLVKTVARNKQRSIGISWSVERNRSDFQWLRSMLLKFYPGTVVPPLPTVVHTSTKLTSYIKKFQFFLLDTYRCRQLRNSKYFEVFLSYSNRKDFQNFMKSSESVSEPGTLSNVLNMKGELTLCFSDKIDLYAASLQQFLTLESSNLKLIKQLTSDIIQQYQNLALKFNQLANLFSKMSDETEVFSLGQTQQEKCFPKLKETYSQIASLIDEHSYFCLKEKGFIDNFMFSHFSYQKDRIDNMQNLILKRNYFSEQFSKRSKQGNNQQSVLSKITNLFGSKTQSLQSPSSNLEILKNQIGFYNSQLLKQATRNISVMIDSYVSHFSNYGNSRVDNVDEMQKTWSHVMVQLSKLSTSK